jgi:hypothetical protein
MSIRESIKSTWMDVTNESVHTSDDVDIGDIEAINRDFLVVKRGFINVHYYYIPIRRVEGWDGHVVWLKIPRELVEQKYHVDKPPDPSTYYIKGYPYDKASPFTADYFPELPIIKRKQSSRPSSMPEIQSEAMRTFRCPLCDIKFRTEDELSSHVASSH